MINYDFCKLYNSCFKTIAGWPVFVCGGNKKHCEKWIKYKVKRLLKEI